RASAVLPVEASPERVEAGRCRLRPIGRALHLRRAQPQFFSDGDSRRRRAHGSRAHYLCAFARRCARRTVVVIAPRLYRRLLGDPARLPLGSEVWENTLIELPSDAGSRGPLRNVLDGAELQPVSHGEGFAIPAAQALARFPVALLSGGGDARAPAGR